MNKKGFTLIELLAVIIILGILMIIAIPSVTKYISDSRKAAYVNTAKQVANATKNLVNSGKLEMYDTSVAYYIPNTCIKVENGEKAKSPYGEFIDDRTYVVVTYDGQGYDYYWVSLDDTGTGVKEPISIDKLNEDNIESDLKKSDVKDNIGLGKESVVIFNPTCDGRIDKDAYSDSIVSTILNEKESQLRKIDENVYIFKGGNPSNYVSFNGETWRILGIYNNQIKLIKSTPLSSRLKYNDPATKQHNWEGSDLESYLNGIYYEGLSSDAKNLISNGIWYIDMVPWDANASYAYTSAKHLVLNRKIGLISVFEFLYASDGDNCETVGGMSFSSMCGTSEHNWLKPDYYSWTLNPIYGNYQESLSIHNEGYIYDATVTYNFDVIPAVFLDSSVTIASGDGTIDNKYVFTK